MPKVYIVARLQQGPWQVFPERCPAGRKFEQIAEIDFGDVVSASRMRDFLNEHGLDKQWKWRRR